MNDGYKRLKVEAPISMLENASTALLLEMLKEIYERQAAREAKVINGQGNQ